MSLRRGLAAAFGLGLPARREQQARLGLLIRLGRAAGLANEEIAELVADRLYTSALLAGGHLAWIGLHGPRRFRRDALRLVRRELRNVDRARPRGLPPGGDLPPPSA